MWFKRYIQKCTNTHHDVTDLVNHGIVKNTETWTSWEWNITYLWNKKILNLCLRYHILRSCCFVVEVTFNFNATYSIYGGPAMFTVTCSVSLKHGSWGSSPISLKENKNLNIKKYWLQIVTFEFAVVMVNILWCTL